MVGAIISTLLAAFVIGVLARWTVPGPDPMPIWMTTGFGLVGALIGNGLVFALVGTDVKAGSAFAAWFLSVLAATLLVIAHRRFVQHRPITGPDAHKPPPGRDRRGPATTFGSPPKGASEPDDLSEQLRRLGKLRDEGAITPEDFERKKAELLARM